MKKDKAEQAMETYREKAPGGLAILKALGLTETERRLVCDGINAMRAKIDAEMTREGQTSTEPPKPDPKSLHPCEEVRKALDAQSQLLNAYRELGWSDEADKMIALFHDIDFRRKVDEEYKAHVKGETRGTKPEPKKDEPVCPSVSSWENVSWVHIAEAIAEARKRGMLQSTYYDPETYDLKPEPELKKGVTKFDDSKTRWDLMPWDALEQVARVAMHGAEKYEIGNWEKGYSWRKMAAAGFRHFTSWLRGKQTDPDSGISHLAHLACCALFLLYYELHTDEYAEFDDRFVDKEAP